MSLNLPDPNKTVGDPGHTSDTNLIIEAVNTVKSQVDNIPEGPQGPPGEPGTPGQNGLAATVTVANTLTSAPGSNAAVTSSGTPQNVALTFTIPRGTAGPTGATGPQGAIGPQGDPGPGLQGGGLTGQVLSKKSDADFDTDWAFPGSAPVTSVDGRQGAVTLDDLYDAAGDASAAQLAAQAYADGVAASAQSAAEDYADSLAPNYDLAGSAASAQSAAEGYADSLAVNYDSAGSAAAAQAAAEGYADSLAVNYDAAGSAAAVAGDLSTHELLTTTVHGISDTADLVYDSDSRLTDARTPTSHATSHEFGGGDVIEIAASQVTGTAIVQSIIDAKGDLLAGTADNTIARVGVGTDGHVLTADSSVSAGVSWQVAAAPVDDPFPVGMFLGGM